MHFHHHWSTYFHCVAEVCVLGCSHVWIALTSVLTARLSPFPQTPVFDLELNKHPDLLRQWQDHTHVWDKNSLYTSLPKNWHLLSQNCVEVSDVHCDDSYLPCYTHAIPCASLQTLSLSSVLLSDKWKWSRFSSAQRLRGFISCDCYSVPFFCNLLYSPNSEGPFQHQHLTGACV